MVIYVSKICITNKIYVNATWYDPRRKEKKWPASYLLSDQRDQNAHTGWFSIWRMIFFNGVIKNLAVSSKDIAATGVRVAAWDSLGKRETEKKVKIHVYVRGLPCGTTSNPFWWSWQGSSYGKLVLLMTFQIILVNDRSGSIAENFVNWSYLCGAASTIAHAIATSPVSKYNSDWGIAGYYVFYLYVFTLMNLNHDLYDHR